MTPLDPPVDGPERLAWADAARGLAVLAVVVFHVGLWHFLPHAPELWSPAARVWSKVNGVLAGVRIPLLLTISGLVLSRRVRRGFSDRSNIVRPLANYYLYVVWLIIYTAFFAVVSYPALPHRVTGVGDFVLQLIVPDTTLWYVFALAVYVPVFSALRAVPPWLVLAVLAALTIGVRATDAVEPQAIKIAEVALFFAIGVYGATPIRHLAASASVVRAGALVVIAAVVTLGGRFMTGEVDGTILFVVRGLTFMVASVVVIAIVVRWRAAEHLLSAVGRQTLPIYVMHPLLICALIAAVHQWSGFEDFLGRPLVSVLYPVVVTVGIAVLSLTLHRLAMHAGLGLLFALPAGIRSRIESRLSR